MADFTLPGHRALGHSRRRSSLLSLTPLLLLLILIGGCQGCRSQSEKLTTEFFATFGDAVECPTSDVTPPAVKLVFEHPASGQQVTLGSGHADLTIPIRTTDRFFVVAVAEDPEGVSKLSIFGPSAPTCKSVDGIGCQVGPGLTVPSSLTPTGALTRLWLPYQVAVNGASCPAGCEFASWRQSISATAVNCSGLEGSSPTLILTVP